MNTICRIATIIALSLVAFLMLEAGLRIGQWERPKEDPLDRDGLGMARYGASRDGYGDLVPNQDGHWLIWYHRPYHVVTNSIGLRSSEEPREGAFRILVLGDSMTFGPYLANEDTWPSWMENRLRRVLGTAVDVQVFNAGVGGYSIPDELSLLREKGIAFEPDLVVLAVLDNDTNDLRPTKRKRFSRDKILKEVKDETRYVLGGLRSFLGENLATYNLVSALKQQFLKSKEKEKLQVEGDAAIRKQGAEQGSDSEKYEIEYQDLLMKTVSVLNDEKISAVIAHIPSFRRMGVGGQKISPVLRAARRASKKSGLSLVELLDRYRDAGTVDSLFLLQWDSNTGRYSGNGHLSRYGAQVTGFFMADWLLANDMINR
jgi:lysophospholipase L1-like esterase